MSDKLYRIGEAAALLNLKSYVLRFWETEFPQLEPVRTDKGQRLYTEEHVELLKLIKHLLHERGLTIDGARRILKSQMEHARQPGNMPSNMPSNLPSNLSGSLLPGSSMDILSEHLPEYLPERLPEHLLDTLPGKLPDSPLDPSSQAVGQSGAHTVEASGFAPVPPSFAAPETSRTPLLEVSSSCLACAKSIERAENAEEIARQYELLLDEFILELEELKALLAGGALHSAATSGSGLNETGEAGE